MSNEAWRSHVSWYLVTPPSRPASWQMAAARSWLSSLSRDAHIGLLGSTPEYQDLVFEFEEMTLTVIDRSETFHRHVACQRRRPAASSPRHNVVIADWTEGLKGHAGQFDAILSDLTSGNVPYESRDSWYRAIHDALKPGGFFIDRVLTLQGELHDRQELYRLFDRAPIGIRTINELNCRLLFSSTLLDGSEIVDIDSMMRQIRLEWTSPVAAEYLSALPFITPSNGRWWYGRAWQELEPGYALGLQPVDDIPEPEGSPYHSHCRLFRRVKGVPPVISPSVDITMANVRRSRTPAVLEECKQLIDQLPLPRSRLGESFLARLATRAVELRDSCLNFRAERLDIDRDHWQFMEGLFDLIEGRPEGRGRTYSFCWCHSPDSPLFQPDSPEWKTLFCKAVRLASNDRIAVRCLMVTESPDSDRMQALARLAADVSPKFMVRFIAPTDFRSILNTAELHGVMDFGVFGHGLAFTTASYVPRVSGTYVWASEEVTRLHDLFDRAWDQARLSRFALLRREGSIDETLGRLEESDRILPLSYIAAIVAHGGASLKLNAEDMEEAFRNCAGQCTTMETGLRTCIELALSRVNGGDHRVRTFVQGLRNVAPPVGRGGDDGPETTAELLQRLTLWQEWEFLEKHWRLLKPPWQKDDVRTLFREANDRPHAHARSSLDLVQFVSYRNALIRLCHWVRNWRNELAASQSP
jgi:hypothetical protein